MNAPFGLKQGKVLLLAEPESFSAAYIRRSLEMFGVPVIAPDGPPDEALAGFDPAQWISVSACVAVDLGQAMLEALSLQQREIPFVVIGQNPGQWFSGPYQWLSPPFAAFQVVELLGQMVANASAAISATLDFSTPNAAAASRSSAA